MTTGPATLAGLGHRKGKLAAGYDADIIVFDPDAQFVVRTRARAASPQGHAVRGRDAVRRRSRDVCARPQGVGGWAAPWQRGRGRWSSEMK